jgi:hypothetical protein
MSIHAIGKNAPQSAMNALKKKDYF